jgi:peroxiredoxin
MAPLGTSAPDFRLPDPGTGRTVSLSDFDDAPVLLVAFICNHCPFVIHIAPRLAELGRDYQAKGVAIVAVSANDIDNYPQDSPPRMAEEVESRGYTFPYLFDETQDVAKAYGAACTPDFFVFDANRSLVYRGQFDGSRPSNDLPVTGADIRAALDAALANQPPLAEQRPSIGCNIKWKPGNEPDYYAS